MSSDPSQESGSCWLCTQKKKSPETGAGGSKCPSVCVRSRSGGGDNDTGVFGEEAVDT